MDWMDMARDEEQSFYQMKFDLAEAKKHRGGRHLEDLAQDASKKSEKPSRDIDPRPYYPMQLDAVKMKRMSDKECQELMKAGKCFGCKAAGHRYRKCPERPKHQDEQETPTPRPKPRVRVADTLPFIEETSSEEKEEEATSPTADAPPAYAKRSLLAAIRKLSMQDREDLLDTMGPDSDQDF